MFFDTIAAINKVVNDFVWGVPAMVCIIGVGLLLSVRTGFLQIRKFPFALKTTIGRMFHKKEAADGAMTPFQAVCTALAGTVGTGNIAGTPNFTDAAWQAGVTDEQLTASITNGKGKVMPAWGKTLSSDQIKGLVAHIRSLKK